MVGNNTVSPSLDTGFGLMANVDYQVNDLFTVRLMPRYVFNVKFSNLAGDSGHAYDLRAGGTIGKDVAPAMRAYGLLALGYFSASFATSTMIPDASGATLTFGAGLTYALQRNVRLYVEGGYEYGFQSIKVAGMNTDFHFKGLELGVGIQAAFGR
jgi:opacity protein-like surface antigen